MFNQLTRLKQFKEAKNSKLPTHIVTKKELIDRLIKDGLTPSEAALQATAANILGSRVRASNCWYEIGDEDVEGD
jgi:hypothetical protein